MCSSYIGSTCKSLHNPMYPLCKHNTRLSRLVLLFQKSFLNFICECRKSSEVGVGADWIYICVPFVKSQYPVLLSSFMTCYRICSKRNTMGGTWSAYQYEAPRCLVFSGVHISYVHVFVPSCDVRDRTIRKT